MPQRIALFGGSFNPPGQHHSVIAQRLASEFDQVRVIPCGPRPDKPVTDSIPAVYRAALADLTFGNLPGVTVDLFDLEQASFTPNWDLQSKYEGQGEVWHVVGGDLITGGGTGQSLIQRTWKNGQELWESARFVVLTRPGYVIEPSDLPPNSLVFETDVPGSSTLIRENLSKGRSVEGLLAPRAQAYIGRYGLYRAPNPGNWARQSLSDQTFSIQSDPHNAKAQAWLSDIGPGTDEQPGFITVLGGDGAMLRCIRERWRERLPFFGINAGHLGFLMNAPEQVLGCPFPPSDVILRQMPLLYIETEDREGRIQQAYGFNDAWLERSTSQSAWLQVIVNGVERIPKLVSDGALVATAAGSTAYARSMGASPLLADTPAWLLVGSNVMEPAHWRSALLSVDNTVEIRSLSPEHRPVQAYVDGLSMGEVVSFRARLSRAASAELAFCASHDMADKIAAIQFHRSSEGR
ncbi:nicotinate (nicotinamide) nucleotide adenylyltransferase [Prosthecobacter fusiformis]|uniref:Probable nicotinate-nucleotide adenylyltransferase n=1 Tax=Prosthecobacter fusiformis TaxID=48464 RepID=A0A4R7RWF3_9BACT|nr:NAD(+)/NADH kinase [Prosthecobacter fusiformis]TDU69348.1 nicotinate (nicotinamide) nucleotide adenylyltransferase [Prosthecobacter fusiformis]